MKLRAGKLFSALLSIVFLFSAIGLQTPAKAADSFVYTDFAANDFGLWNQSSI